MLSTLAAPGMLPSAVGGQLQDRLSAIFFHPWTNSEILLCALAVFLAKCFSRPSCERRASWKYPFKLFFSLLETGVVCSILGVSRARLQSCWGFLFLLEVLVEKAWRNKFFLCPNSVSFSKKDFFYFGLLIVASYGHVFDWNTPWQLFPSPQVSFCLVGFLVEGLVGRWIFPKEE